MTLALPLLVLALAGGAPAEATPPPAPDLPSGLSPGWYARLDTTEGVITARLLPDQAPQAVAYFAAMAEGRLPWRDHQTGELRTGVPYYDGMPVHKVRAGERFEAGDRTMSSRGAPQYWIPPTDGHGPVDFSRAWRMGMTRAAQGRVSGVLFFVTVGAAPYFNPDHPCFAELVGGQEAARRIAESKANSDSRPLNPPVIRSIRIVKVGEPAPLPEPLPYTPKVEPLRPLKGPLAR